MIKHIWRSIIPIIVITLLVLFFISIRGSLVDGGDIRDIIESTGSLGPLTLIALQLFQTIVPFVPGGMLTISGGYVFGTLPGTLYSLIGLIGGSIIVFSISRKYGRPIVKSFVEKDYIKPYFLMFESYGTTFLFISRMIPFFPHDIFNYVVGTTKISRKDFVLATTLGFIPFSLVHNYLGDSLYSKNLGVGFYIIIGIFIIVGVIYFSRSRIFSFLLKKKKYKVKKFK